jgi:iron complex outermembrane receptor protein
MRSSQLVRIAGVRRGLLAAASAAVLASTFAGAAAAQDSDGAQVEELVVTAERREMNLQDTPLSVVAMSGAKIEAKGIQNVADLTLFTPNLAIQGGRGSGNASPSFQIRGISGGGGATGERGVGMYIDNIFVPRTAGSVFRVFDIERIEVLRGPQGTLFGRNSTGGAIRIFTQKPTNDFAGYLRGTLGNFKRKDVIGMINIPIGETLAIRAQAGSLYQEGYVERGPQKLGGFEDKVLRLQARWKPTSNVTADFGFFWNDSKSEGNPQSLVEFDMRPGIEGVINGNYADWLNDAFKRAGQAPLAAFNDPRLVQGPYKAPGICLIDDFNPDWDNACLQFNDNEYWQGDANIVWNINDKLSLTSTTGISQLIHEASVDWQMLGMERRPDNVKSNTFYQEFQFNASLFNDKVDLVTGGNYFKESSRSYGNVLVRRGTSTFSATGIGSPNGDADAGLFTTDNVLNLGQSDSFGAFASATWHVTDKLNVTGGLRYANDKKQLDQTAYRSANFTPAPGTDSTNVTADDSWEQVDWRGTVDYHFTQDIMAYATASKAYRAGSYSFTILQNIPGSQQSGDFIKAIPPEKVINYEVGARATLLGGRLRLNPTLFYMKWSNRQGARQVSCTAEGITACPVGFRILVVNSGDVDTWGLELDGQLALLRNLTFDFSLGLTDYKLADPVANSGPYLFPSQPSPSYNIGATYTVPLKTAGDLNFNLSYSYVGDQPTHPSDLVDSQYILPSYGIVNGRMTWRSPDRKISLSLFANNLLDKTFATYASSFGGGYWDAGGPPSTDPRNVSQIPPRRAIGFTMGRPREVGLTLQYNF